MHTQQPVDDLALWRLEQTHPARLRARRIQYTAYGLAALIGTGTVVGAIAAGVVVFEATRDTNDDVVATTEAEAHLRPRDYPGDRLRWAAPIVWIDAAGVAHRGTIDVTHQLPAGARVPAGLAPDGTLRSEPVPMAESALRGVLTASVIGAAGALVVRVIVPAARRRAESGLVQSWDLTWADWNSRSHGQES